MLIISAKISEREGSTPPSSFYVQLLDYQSHVLALSNQQMSCSCCWCKSRELGGRGSSRFSCITPMVESFFSDLLGYTIGYWAGYIQNPVKHSVQHPRWSFLQKQPTVLTRWLFPDENFAADVRLDSKCASDWRYCKCRQ